MNSAILSVRGVWKSFDEHPVLRGIDLEVEAHQAVVLIGASGSGKSTLLRCMNGLESVDAGTIILDGDVDVTYVLPPDAILNQRTHMFVFALKIASGRNMRPAGRAARGNA